MLTWFSSLIRSKILLVSGALLVLLFAVAFYAYVMTKKNGALEVQIVQVSDSADRMARLYEAAKERSVYLNNQLTERQATMGRISADNRLYQDTINNLKAQNATLKDYLETGVPPEYVDLINRMR